MIVAILLIKGKGIKPKNKQEKTMATYKFTGFSEECGAYIQGALQAKVIGPEGKKHVARDLASLMANGHSRKSASKEMEMNGYSVKGFRVLYANKVA